MPRKAQPAPSQRMLRVGEEVRHILSETLRNGGFDDPVLFESSSTVTVTEVRVSPDLRYATAYVMTLGGINFDEILPALNEAAWFFQQDIGKKVKMRTTPKVRFVKDDSFDEAQKIENILKGINAD
ncbi:MAG: rbfA [Micavibrio sp.]|nr:rbfA [Micavibrio sp.]